MPTSAVSLLLTEDLDDPITLDRLVPMVYEELRSMAHRQLVGDRESATLQTTALVHEAYLKLVGDAGVTGRGRAYFYAAAARAMRQVLVDRARRRHAAKRGGGARPVTLDERATAADAYAVELLDLDRALEKLAKRAPRQARVVECRYFGGLSFEETAAAIGVSVRTAKYDWDMARAWLYNLLKRPEDPA